MPNGLLEVSGLVAGHQSLAVLKEVDLTVDARSILALIGRVGAGKTTLLHSIVGLVKPTAGTIRFDGEDITALPAHERTRRGMALVPEGRRLFKGMTVHENLMVGAHAIHDRAAQRDTLEQVHAMFPVLAERARQVVGTLSGGEQQMCALGRALMSQPRLLVIDELSLGLAPLVVDRLIEAVVAIRDKGTTVLLVEQDVALALSVADKAVALDRGMVRAVGHAHEPSRMEEMRNLYLGTVA
jgi:branched-chain amino acid transport system ATP-binding protein